MFNKIKWFYDENRKTIIKVVLFIIMILLLIQGANYIAKTNNKEKNNSTNSENIVDEKELQSKSIISDTSIGETTANLNNSIIDDFVNYCNKKDINSAYSIISSDCQNTVFNNNVDNFVNNYYNIVFKETRTYSKENWISSYNSTTYKITYANDMLADGKYNNNDTYGDYVTIVNENGNKKLNISSFVGTENISKQYEDENLKIELNYKTKFINYEIYNINITNLITQNITISDKDSNNIYLIDNNSSNYYPDLNNIDTSLLDIKPSAKSTFNIKFMKKYNPDKEIKKLHFNNVIINNDINNIRTIDVIL